MTVTDGQIIGVDDNIEFDASDGSIGDINISFTATADGQALMKDIIFQAGYAGPSGRADAAEVSIGDITLKFTNPDLQQDGYTPPPDPDNPPLDQVTPVPDKNGDWMDLAFFESTTPAMAMSTAGPASRRTRQHRRCFPHQLDLFGIGHVRERGRGRGGGHG